MEHIIFLKKEMQSLVQSDLNYEFPLQPKARLLNLEMTKPGARLLESIVENYMRPFHQKSKEDLRIIYNLSQEVYHLHDDKNPEPAELDASILLFFGYYGYYLNIENQRLIPVVHSLIEKVKHSNDDQHAVGRFIQVLKNKIQREHYSIIEKLKYFRSLTGDYKVPEGASNSHKLLFDKLKEFEYDLVMYILFVNDRFFPLALEMENYLNKNKLIYYGKG